MKKEQPDCIQNLTLDVPPGVSITLLDRITITVPIEGQLIIKNCTLRTKE